MTWPRVCAAPPVVRVDRVDARHVAERFAAALTESPLPPGAVVRVEVRTGRRVPDFSAAFAEFTDELPQVWFEVDTHPAILAEVLAALDAAARAWSRPLLYMPRAYRVVQ